MIHGKSPVSIFKAWLIWLCGLAGVRVLKPGQTVLPAGFSMFSDALAAQIGLGEAIVYQKIKGFAESNARRESEWHFKQGKWWSYGSYPYWQRKYLSWWNVRTVGDKFRSLEKRGLLESDMLGKVGDRTKWYSPAQNLPDGLEQLALWSGKNCQMVRQNLPDSISRESSRNPASRKKPSPARPARDYAGGGGLARWPKPKSSDWDKEMPEVSQSREAQDGEDELLTANTPIRETPIPPVARAPLPPPGEATQEDSTLDAPAETTEVDQDVVTLREFFTGFGDKQVKRLIERHGVKRVYETIEAVRTMDGVRNAPGLVLHRLGLGAPAKWQYPARAERPADYYVSGPYADFLYNAEARA